MTAADAAFAAAEQHAPGTPEYAALTASAQAHSVAALAIAAAQSRIEEYKLWGSFVGPSPY